MSEEPVRGRRRGSKWVKVSHGLYKPASDLSGPHDDLRAWRLVLPPSGVFTHLTAARARGWWLPPLPTDLPTFVAMAETDSRPQRAELLVSRHREAPVAMIEDGVPLAMPTETLLACARDLCLLDVVVLCDSALSTGSCTREDLLTAAAQRRRGAPLLRRALPLVDPRSESAWETLLRVLHTVCHVSVEPQYEIFDRGVFVARADLLLNGTRTIHEYDGADHLSRRRQRKDLARARRLGHAGYVRRGYTSHEILWQAVGILRDIDASLGRPHRPERVRAWHAMLVDSLFTPSGTARLRARWGLARCPHEAEWPPESGGDPTR